MKQTILTLTFLESLTIGPHVFPEASTITVVYLGGGDLLRCQLEDGQIVEIPSSVVRQERTL